MRTGARSKPEPGVSIGVASIEAGAPLEDGVRRADTAMYEAKWAGGMSYKLAAVALPSADGVDTPGE